MTDRSPAWAADWAATFLLCPSCGAAGLDRRDNRAVCADCGHSLGIDPHGTLLALPNATTGQANGTTGSDRMSSVTDIVKRFYEEHPFPNYDGFESVGDLLSRASRSVYAAMLDRQIPVGARILEIGCGTGQLGAFLSVGGRAVVGVDMSSASLGLATDFKTRHGLDNCNFMQGNLFDLPLQPESFDLVICKGVLHHTADARAAFATACTLARPGGYVLVGLYNRIGRIPTTIRRWYFKLLPRHEDARDFVLSKITKSDEKARSWFYDQYLHPHETRHTIDEVLAWFAENDLDFINAAPSIRLGETLVPSTRIFDRIAPGSRLEHFLIQISWIWTISREGALFDMIGRKAGAPDAAVEMNPPC